MQKLSRLDIFLPLNRRVFQYHFYIVACRRQKVQQRLRASRRASLAPLSCLCHAAARTTLSYTKPGRAGLG